jgi:flagellar motor protein MotB
VTPESRRLLKQIVERLRRRIGGFRLVVEGHTDAVPVSPGGPYPNNRALALARARAVTSLLAQAGLPAAALSAVPGDAGQAPYPEGSRDADRRNRTVVIRLVRAPASVPGR